MKKHIIILLIIGIVQISKGQDQDLKPIVNQYLTEYKVPGIAVSVIKKDTVYYGVAGVKRYGALEKIGLESKFHIGSNAKAITATIAAMLVEDNKIAWNSKIVEVLPELKGKIRKEYNKITLENLLSNRGLIQPFEEDNSDEWKGIPRTISNSSNSKLEFAKYALNLEPKWNSNNNHSYSNGGFIIAALMLEKSTQMSWSELLEMFNQKYKVEAILGFPNQELSTATYGHKRRLGKYKAVSSNDEYKFQFDFSAAGKPEQAYLFQFSIFTLFSNTSDSLLMS